MFDGYFPLLLVDYHAMQTAFVKATETPRDRQIREFLQSTREPERSNKAPGRNS